MAQAALALTLVLLGGPSEAAQTGDGHTPENLIIDVQRDPAGGARVRGGVDIPASPTVVWHVMLDCDEAVRYVPKLRSCRVLQTGQGWDIREHVFDYGVLGRIRHVFRSDYTEQSRIRTTRVEGDLKASAGEWRLEPIQDGQATRVRYTARSQPRTPVPGPIARQAIRRDAPASLKGLRQAAARRASQTGPSPR
jgi:hypothetical protein